MERLTQAYQEDLLNFDELRQRLPVLWQTEATLRTQLATLDARQPDRESYLHLAENLESFLGRLSGTARSSPIVECQRVVRLFAKEVLIGPDKSSCANEAAGAMTSTRTAMPLTVRMRMSGWRQLFFPIGDN